MIAHANHFSVKLLFFQKKAGRIKKILPDSIPRGPKDKKGAPSVPFRTGSLLRQSHFVKCHPERSKNGAKHRRRCGGVFAKSKDLMRLKEILRLRSSLQASWAMRVEKNSAQDDIFTITIPNLLALFHYKILRTFAIACHDVQEVAARRNAH